MTIVLDEDFGPHLEPLILTGIPVWIVDSSTNRAACTALWTRLGKSVSLTRFDKFTEDAGALLLSVLDDVLLHHPSVTAARIVQINPAALPSADLRKHGWRISQIRDAEADLVRLRE